MPKRVDHDARRREIVEAFIRITARDGLHAATSRAIAAELGVATGALWHYFANFDAVLSAAFTTVFAATNARIEKTTVGSSGLAALRAMMREILPLEKVTRDEAQIVVSFWGRVAVDESIIASQLEYDELWRGQLASHLSEAISAGELREGTPVGALVDVLLSIAMGQQVEWVTRSSLSEPSRQLALIETCLAPWMGGTGASGAGSWTAPTPRDA